MKDYGFPDDQDNYPGVEDYDMEKLEEAEQKEQELYKDKVSSSDIEEPVILSGEIVEEERQLENINHSPVVEKALIPLSPESLISQAIEKGTPVDVMERLLAMRKELKAEAAKEAYFQALSAFQSECPIIEKRKIVRDKSGDIRYKYAPLEEIISQVKDVLLQHGFSYTFGTEQQNDSITVFCKVHHVDGHEAVTSLSVPIDHKSYMNAAQKVASALTYAKRYSFCDAFGISTMDDDDDSNITGEPVRGRPPRQNNNSGGNNFNNAPEKNKAMYSSIMALFREKINNKPILTPEEMAKYKQKADDVLNNYDSLVNFYKSINKIIQHRRAEAKGENNE